MCTNLTCETIKVESNIMKGESIQNIICKYIIGSPCACIISKMNMRTFTNMQLETFTKPTKILTVPSYLFIVIK